MRSVSLSVSDVRVEFLSVMARALSAYGENADDLEQDLTECARSLGLRAQFFATPTAVFASFRDGDEESTRLLRITEARIDLQALSLVHGVLSGVTAGTTGFTITWTGGLGARYQVQWTPALFPPTWTSFTNIITSTNTQFWFLDDGTQTGGLGTLRFYRPYQIP